MRNSHLARNPFCAECLDEGVKTIATVVDHKKAHKGDERLFFDPTNLQSMCTSCHNRKTAKHDGGFGNRVTQ